MRPRKYPTIEAAWWANTQPTDDGHLLWTASTARGASCGSPVLHYGARTHAANRIAYRIHNGREPLGTVRATCEQRGCVLPAHVDDTSGRQRLHGQLRAITGMGRLPEACRRSGHDQAIEGRVDKHGHAYCAACHREKRAAGRATDPAATAA